LSVRDYSLSLTPGKPPPQITGSIMSSPPCHNSMGRDMRRTQASFLTSATSAWDLKRELFAVLTAEIRPSAQQETCSGGNHPSRLRVLADKTRLNLVAAVDMLNSVSHRSSHRGFCSMRAFLPFAIVILMSIVSPKPPPPRLLPHLRPLPIPSKLPRSPTRKSNQKASPSRRLYMTRQVGRGHVGHPTARASPSSRI